MEPLSQELQQLNEDTLHAANKEQIGKVQEDWEAFLRRVLADDFRISRASRMVDNKEEMIKQIQGDERRREGLADVDGGIEGDYGVVTSVVTVQGDPDTYHHLKLFTRQPSGEWQCVYWRVTRLPVFIR